MNRTLFLISLFVIFTMLIPASELALGKMSSNDQRDVYLPLIQRNYKRDYEPIISDTTEILPEETLQDLTGISESGVFTFTQTSAALNDIDVGDVIVGNVSEASPYGFLRKVTSFETRGGQIVLNTEDATLNEAIQQGSIHISQVLSPSQVQHSEQAAGVLFKTLSDDAVQEQFYLEINNVVLFDEDGSDQTTNDRVTANGSIAFEPRYSFDMDYYNWQLEQLEFDFTNIETSHLEIESPVGLSVERVKREIGRYLLAPVTIPVGPFPVVITPILTVNVGIDGFIEVGVKTGVKQEASLNAGVNYLNGDWDPYASFENQFQYIIPILFGNVGIKGHAGPDLSLMIFGAAGPHVEVAGYLELVTGINDSPDWELYGGLEVPIGVKVEILDNSDVFASFETTAIDYKILLAQSGGNNPPNIPSSPSPAYGAENQSLNTNLSWNGGDPDGDIVTYDIYFEAGDSTPDVLISDDQSSTSSDLHTLDLNTRYYWQIIAKDEHGATSDGPVWDFTTGDGNIIPDEMVFVPAGEFQMGCDPDHNNGYDCRSFELPLHTVYLDAYIIGKYEVTNAQYAAFLNNRGNNDCNGSDCIDLDNYYSHIHLQDSQYEVDLGYENHPPIVITWYGAEAYCAAEGKRLPTEAEWEKAARGSSDTRAFPWGDQTPNCTLANYDDLFGSGSTCIGDTMPVGSYPEGASTYGALDMAGNVWEWVSDWYSGTYYSVSPYQNPLGPDTGTYKVLRGGGFGYTDSNMRVANRNGWNNPISGEFESSFRCAADAP